MLPAPTPFCIYRVKQSRFAATGSLDSSLDRSGRGYSHGLDLSFSVQKVTFGTLGYGPRAQSVLHCHGVLALRQGPWKSRFGPQFLVGSESNVWHSGLRAAGPIRPSLPWCLSPARGSLDRSRAAQKPAARQRRPVLHCHGVLALRQGPWTPAWTAAVAGKVTVWTSVSCRFRK